MAVSSAGRKLNVKKATLHLMKVTVHANGTCNEQEDKDARSMKFPLE